MGRSKRYTTTGDYLAATRRMIRGAGRRVAGADPDALAELVALHQALEEAIRDAVAGMRSQGVTWRWIGESTGTSKEAAVQKWARYVPKPEAREAEEG